MTSPAADSPIAYATSVALGEQRLRLSGNTARLRTRARALAGMQKEALVEYAPTGILWRLLSDEGPWLNGTDLAPFPLGYFAAGLAASLTSDILAEAAARSVRFDAPRLRTELFFTMQGSVLKGNMAAGVDRFEATFDAGKQGDPSEIGAIVAAALAKRSAVNFALGRCLPSRFFLRVNGEPVARGDEADGGLEDVPDPGLLFGEARPAAGFGRPQPIVRKIADASAGETQGAVGLEPEQKRTVHLRADASLRMDGLKEILVECLQPRGSRFVLLSDEAPDDGGTGRAPCGLTYLSAGIAFCFMTQLSRYAQIRKLGLRDYRIVQDSEFVRNGPTGPSASGVSTLVWLDSDDPVADNLRMVQMGEQTCYLHATFRERVDLSVTIGGL